MLRTYAGFIQNTVKPMLNKMVEVYTLSIESGLPLDRNLLFDICEKVIRLHVHTLILQSILYFTLTLTVCITTYLILT